MGQSMALKLQSLLDVLYLEHIPYTCIIIIGTVMKKGKGGPGPEKKK